MTPIRIFIALVIASLLTGVASAHADGLSISLDTVVRDSEGSVTSIGVHNTGREGRECTATFNAANNSSIHPGNNIEVVSATSYTLVDVEAEGRQSETFQITVGATVEVFVIMGPDKVYSGGGSIDFDCPPVPTTTEVPPSTTTATTSTSTTTTTTTSTSTSVPSSSTSLAPTTTAPASTSTSSPTTSTSTSLPRAVRVTTTTLPKLPETGSGHALALLALLALSVGTVLAWSARRP